MSEPSGLSQEARELLRLHSLESQRCASELAGQIGNQIATMQDRFERRIDGVETRLTGQLDEIKQEQRSMRDTQEEQGRDIVEVKTRLNEGDKRFNELERRVAEQDRQYRDAIGELEQANADQDKQIAPLAVAGGGVGIGGAITWAVMKLFGGH